MKLQCFFFFKQGEADRPHSTMKPKHSSKTGKVQYPSKDMHRRLIRGRLKQAMGQNPDKQEYQRLGRRQGQSTDRDSNSGRLGNAM